MQKQTQNQTKPIFTMSASLFNQVKWLKSQKTDYYKQQAIEQFKNAVNKVFVDNEHTLRGKQFEDEVFNGLHTELVIGINLDKTENQKWFNRYIEYADFIIKLVGKMDIYDYDNKQIYDIKRSLNLDYRKYEDDRTIQHDLYLYLNPDAKRFWYLVGYGEEGKSLGYTAFPVERKPDLEQYILKHIQELLQELQELDLLELYFQKYRVDF